MSVSEAKLEDVLDFYNGKAPPKTQSGAYPVFGSNGQIGWSDNFNHERAIIIGRVGAYCGSIEVCAGKFWASDNTIVVKPKPDNDLKYMYYKLGSMPLRGYAGGAAQPLLTQGVLKSVRSLFADPTTQLQISNILDNYDNLIENNKRRLELLEESARQLYKEWFVRFRFPGHEHVKIIDGVPERWNPKTLSDIATVVKDTVDPKNIPETTPYIGLEHLPRRSITLNEWENARKVTSSKFSFKCGDILFGKIRPYFHKVGFTLTDGITSSDAIVLRPEMQNHYCIALAEVSSDAFVALASKTVREGSKMPRADWDVLKNRIVLEPPEAILNVFNNQIEGILNQCKLLSFQNFSLIKARDILLPKLMSGEIAV